MAQEMIEVKPMVNALKDAVARLQRMHLASLAVKEKARVDKAVSASKKKKQTAPAGSS